MTTLSVASWLKKADLQDANIIQNGFMDRTVEKCISVSMGPDTRAGSVVCLGGADCSDVSVLPVNVTIRWTQDTEKCQQKANSVYEIIALQGNNFVLSPTAHRIAFFRLLDGCPIGPLRDDRNVCESIIRFDVHYYN
jgi:hypothetical protein